MGEVTPLVGEESGDKDDDLVWNDFGAYVDDEWREGVEEEDAIIAIPSCRGMLKRFLLGMVRRSLIRNGQSCRSIRSSV